jgi:hypothetical protein
MREIQARTADLKSIGCSWPEYDRETAVASYRTWTRLGGETLRGDWVLVIAEWETPDEANAARIRWLEEMAKLGQVVIDVGHGRGQKHDTVREAIDAARGRTEPNVTVIERPAGQAKGTT